MKRIPDRPTQGGIRLPKQVLLPAVKEPKSSINSASWELLVKDNSEGLFKLPREIREMIWRYVLESAAIQPYIDGRLYMYNPVQDETDSKLPIHDLDIYDSVSVLCRQVYLDVVARHLVFDSATFYFHTPDLMEDYLGSISEARRNSIKRVHLRGELFSVENERYFDFTQPVQQGLEALSRFQSLEDLTLDILCDSDHNGANVKGSVSETSITLVKTQVEKYLRVKPLRSFRLRLQLPTWLGPNIVVWPKNESNKETMKIEGLIPMAAGNDRLYRGVEMELQKLLEQPK